MDNELHEIATTSLDLIRELYKHEFGVPKIRQSVLSSKELRYLELCKQNDIKPVGNAEQLQPIRDALYRGDTIRDNNLHKLLESRDSISDKIQEKRNVIANLQQQKHELDRENRTLHDKNAKLVGHITSKMDSLRMEQRSQFSQDQLQEYNDTIERLKEAKAKSAVLSEFITALIAASGIDWSSDLYLTSLVLSNNDIRGSNDDDLMS